MNTNGRDVEEDDSPSIAALWSDGNEDRKVFTVLPMENPPAFNGPVPKPCPVHGYATSAASKYTLGIDNIAFYDIVERNQEQSGSTPSSLAQPGSSNASINRSSSLRGSTARLSSATTSVSRSASSAGSISGSTPSRSTSTRSSGSRRKCKCKNPIRSSIRSTFGAVAYTNSIAIDEEEPSIERTKHPLCTCPKISSDESISVSNAATLNSFEATSSSADESNRIRFLKKNMLRPDCSEASTSDNVVICAYCHNEIAVVNSAPFVEVDINEEPPPKYSSLWHIFLLDEPPRYQDVTGKALTTTSAVPQTRERYMSERTRKRIVIACAVVFFLLIGALLVYACFVSGNPLEKYGDAKRKF